MIKNNTIQLGNFVKDRKGNVIKIDFIEHLENGYSTKIGMYQEDDDPEFLGFHPLTEYTDFAEPLKISGHWLIKLGFEEIEQDEESKYCLYSKNIVDEYYLECHYNSFEFIFSLRETNRMMPDETFYIPSKFKYVHQLQNFLNCL
jgi:hypothetical protein